MAEAIKFGVAFFCRLICTVCFLIAAGAPYAHADDNAAANKLFVEVVQMVKKAAAAQPTEAIGLYEQALQNLDRIVATYPGSMLAVQIVSGQSIGHVSRTDIEQALLKVRQVECAQNPRVVCVLTVALETARSIKESQERAEILGAIAVVQAQAGHKEEARQTLTAALETARSIKNSDSRAVALIKIAAAQAQARDQAAALETASSIEHIGGRAVALSEIAKTMVKLGLNNPIHAGSFRQRDEGRERLLLLPGEAKVSGTVSVPNIALEPTAYSLRSCVASASGRG